MRHVQKHWPSANAGVGRFLAQSTRTPTHPFADLLRRLHVQQNAGIVIPMWGSSRTGTNAAPGPSDQQVLVSVAEGDEAAFEVLYDRMSPVVFGLIRRVLRDRAQSEEVTQEVFLEIWRSAPAYDAAKGTARTWILTMAHRRAVDRVRASQSAIDREDRAGRQDVQRPYDSVAETVELRLDQEAVHKALDALTELQRQAVQLAYFGGYTHTEVSALLDVPLGTVKARIRDGLIRLRDVMGVTA
jgi:RNA polymerase sigma-70 factor (ECF subfamily)